jgi:hypothetical protein
MRRTRWQVVQDGVPGGEYESAKGRLFRPGDSVVLPPPFPKGRMWRVTSVEDAAGFDGRLVLESAAVPPMERPERD